MFWSECIAYRISFGTDLNCTKPPKHVFRRGVKRTALHPGPPERVINYPKHVPGAKISAPDEIS